MSQPNAIRQSNIPGLALGDVSNTDTLPAPGPAQGMAVNAGGYPPLSLSTSGLSEVIQKLGAASLQAGVLGAAGAMVTQRGAGANNSVDVAAGPILVPAGSGLLATVAVVASNVVIAANPSGSPLVGSIFVGLDGFPVYSAGTPQAGATLDNAAGATSRSALGATQIRLAEFVVAAGFGGASTLPNTAIRDRRPWARGASFLVTGNAGGNHTTISTASFDLTPFTAYACRVECSGVPLELSFSGRAWNTTATSGVMMVFIDGGSIEATVRASLTSPAASEADTFHYCRRIVPSAGSHSYSFAMLAITSGTATVANTANDVPAFTLREIVAQNSKNNATTSG